MGGRLMYQGLRRIVCDYSSVFLVNVDRKEAMIFSFRQYNNAG